ncbi:GspE/PulE family protein [Trinickia soli]|uniref:GspE family protein n=1 Tax=Trinickia soli TaxID=380675 RepID=A0A2N7W8R0_9BURK|nr:GspE/PulE family protein [Trinickia soli]KAA0081564.1 type II/IV secretion system protein [Paraburkholderia sp. T12-10]PMS25796.1 GspE family protein [Trinickia soli]CAB3641868.1 Type II secretion system protein E [Trinickia soli]
MSTSPSFSPLVATQLPDEGPAARLFAQTLDQAARRAASDIHVEPSEHSWRIRLRVDGTLHELPSPPAHLRDAFVTRVKVLARLDIAERRVPQDGRLRLAVAPGKVEDYRVSALPTVHGEKLVLRRLEALPADLSLASLGFDAAQTPLVEAAVQAPHGLILVTGPTGSGKTLSLYAFLQMLNQGSRNICTVEDPAEIELAGVNQVSVREKAGLTFATALRALLRQDPDVIMIGEIRDAETADVALKAAQTGHLVLSTLHTNDAPGAIARLIHIGVAPYNLAAALRLITAQRLLRRLCAHCRTPAERPCLASIVPTPTGQPSAAWTPYAARGCPACHGVGYRGRIGIHEVMPASRSLCELIGAGASMQAIRRQARAEGAASLREAALARVREGLTSVAEALAATDDA